MPLGRPRKAYNWVVTRRSATISTSAGPITITATSRETVEKLVRERFGPKVRCEVVDTQLQLRTWMPAIREDGSVGSEQRRFSSSTREGALLAFTTAKHEVGRALWERFGADLPASVPFEYASIARAWQNIHEGRDESSQLKGQPTLSQWIEKVFDAKLGRSQIVQNTRDTIQHVINGQINQPFTSSSHKQPIAIGHLRLKDVTQERLQEFADALGQRKKKNGDPLSPEYISRVFDYIRIAWRLLRRDQLLKRYAGQLSFDAEDLQLPKARLQARPNRAYSGAEVEQLITACKDAYETAIIGLGLLGVRMPGEGRAVLWTDFHEIDGKRFLIVGRQVVNEGKGRSTRHRKSTEGAERVTLWIPERLWKMIAAVKPISEELGCDYVLATSHKGEACPMSAKSIQTKFASLKKRAEIVRDGATMYALRHTAVSFTMEVGGEEAARLIGAWSTPKVLREHYDQSRATVILPRAGEQLPWAAGEVPSVVLPKLRRG